MVRNTVKHQYLYKQCLSGDTLLRSNSTSLSGSVSDDLLLSSLSDSLLLLGND